MYELADMFGGYNLVASFELLYRKVGADYSHGRCTTQHCGASVDWRLGVAMILAYTILAGERRLVSKLQAE